MVAVAELPRGVAVVEQPGAAPVVELLRVAVVAPTGAEVTADSPGAALVVDSLRAAAEASADLLAVAPVAEPPGAVAVALLRDLSFATLVELAHCDPPREAR